MIVLILSYRQSACHTNSFSIDVFSHRQIIRWVPGFLQDMMVMATLIIQDLATTALFVSSIQQCHLPFLLYLSFPIPLSTMFPHLYQLGLELETQLVP
mmetsp:Transcript_20489/g.43023  ORF Transcript_20489/g.43023 Transcript_20489/m.43023 type:complete len:98 (-) Transcript_20489:838-1131(-)